MNAVNDEALAEYTDTALAEIAIGMKEQGRKLLDMAARAQYELQRRMEERGATKWEEGDYAGSLKPGAWEADEAMLDSMLRPLLTGGELYTCLTVYPPPPPRWNQAALNALEKRGEPYKSIIDRARVRGRATLVLERRDDEHP